VSRIVYYYVECRGPYGDALPTNVKFAWNYLLAKNTQAYHAGDSKNGEEKFYDVQTVRPVVQPSVGASDQDRAFQLPGRQPRLGAGENSFKLLIFVINKLLRFRVYTSYSVLSTM